MSSLVKKLLNSNKQWAERITQLNPNFFAELSKQQSPEYLWIGCSDSRVPANQIVDLPPGGVFVHRNIANVVVHTDLNCLSVIQFAVEVLKVQHIIVCGHYGCGGIKASMENRSHGLIDNWLCHIKDVSRLHANKLKKVIDDHERFDLLCELNVIEQVKNVSNTTVVQDAWRKGANLSVHGWVYSLQNGIIKNLEVSVRESRQSGQRLNKFS